jgi:hypothetical protein
MIRDRVVDACAQLTRDHLDRLRAEDLQPILHARGLSIMEAILVTRRLFRVRLGVAKEMVSSHQAWRADVDAALPLHEEAWQMMEDLPIGQKVG